MNVMGAMGGRFDVQREVQEPEIGHSASSARGSPAILPNVPQLPQIF